MIEHPEYFLAARPSNLIKKDGNKYYTVDKTNK